MKLLLSPSHMVYSRDEIGVIQDGVPIPYEWTGPLEITVDDVFERAAIQVTPKPRWPASVYKCAKCGAEHVVGRKPGSPSAGILMIICNHCRNTLIIDDAAARRDEQWH